MTVELEAYDSNSGLFRFEPQVVVILQSLTKLKPAYYDFPGDQSGFSKTQANRLEGVWKAIQAGCSASIIQSIACALPGYGTAFEITGAKAGDTLYRSGERTEPRNRPAGVPFSVGLHQ